MISYAGFNVEGFWLISDTSKQRRLTITHQVRIQIMRHYITLHMLYIFGAKICFTLLRAWFSVHFVVNGSVDPENNNL